MLPVVDMGFDPNAAKLAATLALPYELVIPVSCEPLPKIKLPVMLPVAEINPTVPMLPMLAFPVTLSVSVFIPPSTAIPFAPTLIARAVPTSGSTYAVR